jgi:hypothetical protein
MAEASGLRTQQHVSRLFPIRITIPLTEAQPRQQHSVVVTNNSTRMIHKKAFY